MAEITKGEIIHSLETCGTEGKCCLGCSFYTAKTTSCVRKLAAAALMLILEQDKQIEQLADKH